MKLEDETSLPTTQLLEMVKDVEHKLASIKVSNEYLVKTSVEEEKIFKDLIETNQKPPNLEVREDKEKYPKHKNIDYNVESENEKLNSEEE